MVLVSVGCFFIIFFSIHLFGPHQVMEKGGSVWQNVRHLSCCRVKLTNFNILRRSAAFASSYASGSIVKYCSVVGKWRANENTVWGLVFGGVEASSLQGSLLNGPKVSLHLKALQKGICMKQKSWKLSTAARKNRHLLGMAQTRPFWVEWTLRCEQKLADEHICCSHCSSKVVIPFYVEPVESGPHFSPLPSLVPSRKCLLLFDLEEPKLLFLI